MGNAMLCGAGDGAEATWMVTDMVNGGNTLLCNEHLPAFCYDVLAQSGLVGAGQDEAATQATFDAGQDGDAAPEPADAGPVADAAPPQDEPVADPPPRPRRRSGGN